MREQDAETRTQTEEDGMTVLNPAQYCPKLPPLTLTCVQENGCEIDSSLTPETLLKMPGQVIRIGRAEDAYVRFTDRTVSRNHLRLGCDASGYWVEDDGSRAGTVVNGVKYGVCQRVWLNDGDRLRLGKAVLEVRIPEKADDPEHTVTEEETVTFDNENHTERDELRTRTEDDGVGRESVTWAGERLAETDPDEDDYCIAFYEDMDFDSFPHVVLRRWMDDGSIINYRIVFRKHGGVICIGSGEGMDIRLDAREGVAPRHLVVSHYQTHRLIPFIRIADEKNKVWLDGGLCFGNHKFRLYHGAVIRVGNVELEVIFDEDTPNSLPVSSKIRNAAEERTEVLVEVTPPEPWIQPYVEARRRAGQGTVRDFIPHLELHVINGDFLTGRFGNRLYLTSNVSLRNTRLQLLPGKVAELGSYESATFCLLGDVGGVAPFHLAIGSNHPGQFWIMDNNTHEGTYIDGVRCEPLKPYPLKERNKLMLGGVEVEATICC